MRSPALFVAALLLASCVAALASAAAPASAGVAVAPHKPLVHRSWVARPLEQRPDPSAPASLALVLAARDGPALEQALQRVSDPSSADYLRYPPRAQVRAWAAQDEATLRAHEQWAAGVTGGIDGAAWSWNGARDILRLRLPVARMEALLGHALHEYVHASGATCLRASVASADLLAPTSSSASSSPAIPPHLRASVAYVAGVTRFPPALEVAAHANAHAKARVGRLHKHVLRGPATANDAAAEAEAAAMAAAAAARSSAGANAGAGSLRGPPLDPWGLDQILYNVQLTTDDRSVQGYLFVPCTAPVSGGTWTFPDSTGHCVFDSPGGSARQAYAGATVVLSLADGSNATQHKFPASRYPLAVMPGADAHHASGALLLPVTFALPSNFDAWRMSVTYAFVGPNTVIVDYPFDLRGTPRIRPLTVRQGYDVPDALLAGVGDEARAKMSMSIGALAVSQDELGFYNTDDIRHFLNDNHMDIDGVDQLFYLDGSTPSSPLVESQPGRETNLDVGEVIGMVAGVKLQVLHIGGLTSTPFEDLLDLALADASINVLSLSYGVPEDQLPESVGASNVRFTQLGLRGVSVFVSSGDNGAFWSECGARANQSVTFRPSFPGSSPFVTSVGGSTLARSVAGSCPGEVVASVESGGTITAGGGFSTLPSQGLPAWQSAAVQAWLADAQCPKPDARLFNAANRAYPDVALLAHNYEIRFRGNVEAVDGTSASAPALAGIIASYNLRRIAAGLPTLGFLNPALYQAFASDARTFNDITSGGNRCLAAGNGCCAEGFEACKGFDAASGLGSPNFAFLGPVLLNAGNPGAPIQPPSSAVSNNFIPDCPDYVDWGPAPPYPSSGRRGLPLALVVAIVVLCMLLAAAGVCLCVRRYHAAKYGSASWGPLGSGPMAPASGSGRGPGHELGRGPAGPGAAGAARSSSYSWGPGRQLGSPGANDLRVPLANQQV